MKIRTAPNTPPDNTTLEAPLSGFDGAEVTEGASTPPVLPYYNCIVISKKNSPWI